MDWLQAMQTYLWKPCQEMSESTESAYKPQEVIVGSCGLCAVLPWEVAKGSEP